LALGRKTIPAAIIPKMAIRNSDVIVQAMLRLPLHKASMVAPKTRRAITVRYRCVSSRKGRRWPSRPYSGSRTILPGNDALAACMPHFLLTFGDARRPPVGAVIIEAPSMFQARVTAVVRRLAPGVPFSEGLTLSAKMMTAIPPEEIGRMMSGVEAAEMILQLVEGRGRPRS
jgi:hypothetical protein